jgi:D-3-phosphoglycerate dehydrogenase
MLYVENTDKPGFIGALGSVLGDANTNIANFNLGREEEGGKALALIGVDNRVTDDVLEAVNALEHVVDAKRLSF